MECKTEFVPAARAAAPRLYAALERLLDTNGAVRISGNDGGERREQADAEAEAEAALDAARGEAAP